MDTDNIEAIENDNNIEHIECQKAHDVIYPPSKESYASKVSNNNLWPQQWDIKRITNDGASFKLHNPSEMTTIAIIDSGLDIDNIEIRDSVVDGSKNFVPEGGYENSEEYETGMIHQIDDKTGHGTAVASQITANYNMRGVAPGIKIRSYRVFGQSSAKASWIIKAIIEATRDGNDVINISTGQYLMKNGKYSNGSDDMIELKAYKRAVDYAFSKGSIVVSSVGNDSLNTSDNNEMIKYLNDRLDENVFIEKEGKVLDVPNNFNNVVSVGGSDYTGSISNFTNYGCNSFDILAPAGTTQNLLDNGILHFFAKKLYIYDFVLTASLNNTYVYDVGNSFAAPKVSGTLGLIIDKYGYHNQPRRAINHLFNASNKKIMMFT